MLTYIISNYKRVKNALLTFGVPEAFHPLLAAHFPLFLQLASVHAPQRESDVFSFAFLLQLLS